MADSRYKNGVYRGAAIRMLARQNWESNHPATYGWTFSHWDDKERAVYNQGSYELRFVPDENGWFVCPTGSVDGHIYRNWPVSEVTADLELSEGVTQ